MSLKITKPATPPASAVGDPPSPPSNAPTKTAAARPHVPPRAPSSSKWKNKVILSTLDGKIEWDKMTPDARKAFEELFADPKFLTQFGVTKKEGAFDPEQMKALYDGISVMYQTVVGFLLRWPAPILKMLAYTEEQKNMLAKPTADLVNRFAPMLVMENKELLIFLAVFGSITQKNFMAATTELKKLVAENKRGAPGAAATPARVDEPPKNPPIPFAVPTGENGAAAAGTSW